MQVCYESPRRDQCHSTFSRLDIQFEAAGQLVEQELRKQTQFFFLSWAVILAAIIGLYAR